jgi:hypothetical protein
MPFGAILLGMEPLAKCMSVLRTLIAQAPDDVNSIVLAEKAVDGYLSVFQTAATKTGAIAILQEALNTDWRASIGSQLNFINLVLDYLDGHMRDLRE